MHFTIPLAFLLAPFALAQPSAPTRPELDRRIPLTLHHARQYSDDLETRQDWLKGQAAGLRRKYADHLGETGKEMLRRDVEEQERRDNVRRSARIGSRATGNAQLVDVGIDASYSAQVNIGSPAQSFLLIMDTGSSDLWVAGSECTSSSCTGVTTFSESGSSSYSTSNAPFNISYGSGDADGFLASDTVEMAGFTVTGQTFAVVTSTTARLINAPLSGLMGLAWKSIASSGATPFWQALAASGSWDQQEMGFYMARYRGSPYASSVEVDGGELTLGGLNSSLYTGDVNYVSIAEADLDYWRIPVQGLNIQNNAVSVTSSRGYQPQAAIDTGTTLIGVPSSVASAIYSQISGSQALSQQSGYQGYYEYPCSTNVNVNIQFGGLSYTISNADMNLGSFTRDTSMCTGAFFAMDMSAQSPIQWIVGASFLKNVYSAFRYNPPAIGFAALANGNSSVSTGSSSNATTSGGTTGSGSGSGSSSSATTVRAGGVLALLAVAGSLAAAL
ncbi:hypothetical protein IAU60_005937 [Kwoniella sp. DSM 27419]